MKLPRVAPTEPAQAIHTFELHKGLRIELVASEPLIESSVGICFDEDGRLFVVEMRDYPDLRDEKLGRIKLLESTHHDGRYDKATVFAEHLPWPTSVFCYGGGVFVTASPDILFLKDSRHDGVADMRQTVFTGFGATVDRLNVQALPNNLVWGLDNRIHGATSFNGGLVSRSGSADKSLDLHGRDFSFDPRRLQISYEAGGGQHGLSFDSVGRKFVCMSDKPIETFDYDLRYAARNPLYAMPSPLRQINADGPDVFRISPDEAWRVLRTRWRVSGVATGPIEGGGRPSGYFTGASGITVYIGDALPADFRDNAFIGEVANNLVHREIIQSEGVTVVGHRAPDEPKSEFLASRDIWFRPVQLANGPDGALYVIDMYREVIEHPWSLPEEIRAHLDLHSGEHRGRIWRIVPENFVVRPMPRLSNASTPELVALLEHPNGWHRDTAARLLYERQDRSATPLLEKLLSQSHSAIGRLRALCLLDGLGGLSQQALIPALHDRDEHVRHQAVLLAEPFLRTGADSPALWSRLREMTADPSAIVRYQLAFGLGESRRPQRVEALARIAQRDLLDADVRSAVLSSSAGIEAALFASIAADSDVQASSGGREFLAELALMIGQSNRQSDVAKVVETIAPHGQGANASLAFLLARSLRQGLRRAGGRMPEMPELFGRARSVAAGGGDVTARVQAIALLGTTSFRDSAPVLLPLLAASGPQAVQLAAVEALDHFADPQVAPELLKRLPSFSPRLRLEAIAALLKRSDRALALLESIQAGTFHRADLTSVQSSFLINHPEARVRSLARKLLSAPSPRDQVIRALRPALQLSGNAAHGREIYLQRCSMCHRLGGQGFAVGPDLVTVRNAGKEKTLVNILDPNREVAPNYVAYLVETRSGESMVGIIAAETPTSLTVRQPYGKDTVVLRSEVKRIASQRLSLMPEGVEEGLAPQDLADLLEYIFSAPSAKASGQN